MRSYIYANNSFQSCKDGLPPTVGSGGDYTARRAFENALEKLGFSASTFSPDSFTSRLGNIIVYARDHSGLSADRKANEPHDFLCILRIGRSYIRVWINDFPTLVQFFQEVDAREEDKLSEDVRDFLKSSSLNEVLSNLSGALSEVYLGNLEITVKPPKPQGRK
jgi:hypothetical protein